MVRLRNILKGWGRAFGIMKTPAQVQEIAKARQEICSVCIFAERSKLLEVVNGNVEYVDSLYCTKCKCPCKEKSLVLEEHCPIKLW